MKFSIILNSSSELYILSLLFHWGTGISCGLVAAADTAFTVHQIVEVLEVFSFYWHQVVALTEKNKGNDDLQTVLQHKSNEMNTNVQSSEKTVFFSSQYFFMGSNN